MTQEICDDAEAGLEFLPLPVWDMGPVTDSTGVTRSLAVGMYSYDDNTTPFRVPGKIWEPTTDPVTRCGEDSSNKFYALHAYGGPFMEWGGGFGRMLKCMNTDSTDTTRHPWANSLNINKYLCGARSTTNFRIDPNLSIAACKSATIKPENRTDLQKVMLGVCPQRDLNYARDGKPDETDEPYMTGMGLDLTDHVMHDASGIDIPVRGWEGIAFWARRSLNSQEGLRVAIADKFVDDDMMYLSQAYDPNRPRYCEREATCGCNNNKPCTPLLVDYMLLDVDGNRIRYSNDPHVKPTLDNPCPKIPAVDADGRSLINLSGEVVKDANGKNRSFPDGSEVSPYNGCLGHEFDSADRPVAASGQPWQTDVRGPQTYGFCFDPAVDPTPPPGLPAELINHRVYQDPRDPVATVNNYQICGGDLFTPAKPADEWIRFFCNINQDPAYHEVPGYNYTVCGNNSCNLEYPSLQAPDPKYHGRSCTPFAMTGSITRSYCYNRGSDPNPVEGTEQCGDFWMKPVSLSTDWTFIKIPFTAFLQQGWAKRQYQLDLGSLTDVRIQWDRGWMDYWISDVRFYRTKQ